MCSMIDSGEKGYKLPEQILFNSLVLYLTRLEYNAEVLRKVEILVALFLSISLSP